jgi:hypothetical protein
VGWHRESVRAQWAGKFALANKKLIVYNCACLGILSLCSAVPAGCDYIAVGFLLRFSLTALLPIRWAKEGEKFKFCYILRSAVKKIEKIYSSIIAQNHDTLYTYSGYTMYLMLHSAKQKNKVQRNRTFEQLYRYFAKFLTAAS